MTSEKTTLESQNFYLSSPIQLLVHTRSAANFLKGNWRHGNMGLLQFGMLTFQLWKASKMDDPYADWYLMKLFDAIEEKKAIFKSYEQHLQEKLSNIRGMEINLFTNAIPYKFPLKFNNPFGFMGAFLVENLDYLTRQLFTLYQLGIARDHQLNAAILSDQLKEVFELARRWKHTGVIRADLKDHNQKAQKAIKLMGNIPAIVLNHEVELSFLPKSKEVKKDTHNESKKTSTH